MPETVSVFQHTLYCSAVQPFWHRGPQEAFSLRPWAAGDIFLDAVGPQETFFLMLWAAGDIFLDAIGRRRHFSLCRGPHGYIFKEQFNCIEGW